ncbi:hypothetical protein E2C01_028402 [Portunus trituberculatus]|uniref:Uncharacterized protein n=1 Tax=Portunus trituberculatus TaxID=210409 RepID=A0A5B7ENJ3_PORTR|nr:hypothetical protein [Portunus trituberculatus]
MRGWQGRPGQGTPPHADVLVHLSQDTYTAVVPSLPVILCGLSVHYVLLNTTPSAVPVFRLSSVKGGGITGALG